MEVKIISKQEYINKQLELTEAMLKYGYTPEEKQEYFEKVCRLNNEIKELEKQLSLEELKEAQKESDRAIWLMYHA